MYRRNRTRTRKDTANVTASSDAQLALPIMLDTVPSDGGDSVEVASVVTSGATVRICLSKASWVLDTRCASVLPMSLRDALEVGCHATPGGPAVAKASPSMHVEHGFSSDDLREYFVKDSGVTGILHMAKSGDHWTAKMVKGHVPYVLTKAAVKGGHMPPLGKSALPASLERVTPAKFQYWKAATLVEAGAIRNALVEADFFAERLVKVVDGDFRLCVERLFLYEPEEHTEAEKARSVTSVLQEAVPSDVVKLELSTPLASGEDIGESLRCGGKLVVLSVKDSEELDTAVHTIAKGTPVSPWIVECEDNPRNLVSLGVVGRVFKLDCEGGEKRAFAASFPVIKTGSVKHVDFTVYPPTSAQLTSLPDTAFLHVVGNHRAFPLVDVTGQPTPMTVRKAMAECATSDLPEEAKLPLLTKAADMLTAVLATPTPVATEAEQLEKRDIKIAKAYVVKDEAGADLRIVYGIVLEPETVDAQSDVYSAEEIRKTAHEYMAKYRTIGLMHKGAINDKTQILESYCAPADFNVDGQPVKAGTWVMAVKVLDDALWASCKSGELTGFSIGGSAVRKPEPAPG